MVRALLAGTKTQTRRIVKLPRWASDADGDHVFTFDGLGAVRGQGTYRVNPLGWPHAIARRTNYVTPLSCPYGQPGDQLWVKENWRASPAYDLSKPSGIPLGSAIGYLAGGGDLPASNAGKQRTSLFMPRWASRITLEVTGVRVERLQAISEADAAAEGVETEIWDMALAVRDYSKADAFFQMWTEEVEGFVELDEIHRASYRTLWESINGAGSWKANPSVWVVSFRRLP